MATKRKSPKRVAQSAKDTFTLARVCPEVEQCIAVPGSVPKWFCCRSAGKSCSGLLCCISVKFRIPPESYPVNPREKIQLPNYGVSKKLREERSEYVQDDGEDTARDDKAAALEDLLDSRAECVSFMRHSIQKVGSQWYSFNFIKDYNESNHPTVVEHRKGAEKRKRHQQRIAASRARKADSQGESQ